ncbi:fatty acid-binding protein, adipocyte-like [Mytilus edulis]|uniref:fatty acid-binding protein, adipocyte-like n=1 Tax=Mytilus edulis TaxID=6550 RepID=UPI0039EEF497
MSTDEMKEKFDGKWKVYKSENLDEILKALEIGFPLRKIAAQFSPVHTITIDGRKINLIIEAGPKKKEEDFLLDAEVDKKTEDGRDGKCMTTYTDGVWTTLTTPNDTTKSAITVSRVIQGGDLVMTISRGDVTGKRIFKRT